jgi:hypothetical protein
MLSARASADTLAMAELAIRVRAVVLPLVTPDFLRANECGSKVDIDKASRLAVVRDLERYHRELPEGPANDGANGDAGSISI